MLQDTEADAVEYEYISCIDVGADMAVMPELGMPQLVTPSAQLTR